MPNLDTILAESQLYNALYGETAAATKTTYDLEGQKNNQLATAKALNLEAGGQLAEAGQYDTAGALSTQNAQLELVSGQIQQFQTMRQLTKTLGAQTAGVAGAGFAGSGSAVDLARSSLQQGLLQSQVEGVNANIAASGYFTQAAASAAEATAARTAAGVSTANANAATDLATNTANESTALSNLSANTIAATKSFLNNIPGFDPNNPLGQQQNNQYGPGMISSPLANNPNNPSKPNFTFQPWGVTNQNAFAVPAAVTPQSLTAPAVTLPTVGH